MKKTKELIAALLMPIITPNLVLTEVLEESERGTNGFGSTGI